MPLPEIITSRQIGAMLILDGSRQAFGGHWGAFFVTSAQPNAGQKPGARSRRPDLRFSPERFQTLRTATVEFVVLVPDGIFLVEVLMIVLGRIKG